MQEILAEGKNNNKFLQGKEVSSNLKKKSNNLYNIIL